MFSKNTLTILLILTILTLAFQTYQLFSLTQKVEDLQVKFCGSAVKFGEGGATPDMVGGC